MDYPQFSMERVWIDYFCKCYAVGLLIKNDSFRDGTSLTRFQALLLTFMKIFFFTIKYLYYKHISCLNFFYYKSHTLKNKIIFNYKIKNQLPKYRTNNTGRC